MLRYFEMAKAAAANSEHNFKHGAVLVRGGKVIAMSFNKTRHVSWMKSKSDFPSLHAEVGALLNMPKDKTNGSDMYVCRINRQGEYRMSKPCDMCRAAMAEMKVKRVYYTGPNGEFIKETIT